MAEDPEVGATASAGSNPRVHLRPLRLQPSKLSSGLVSRAEVVLNAINRVRCRKLRRFFLLSLLLVAGCAKLGPNYARPQVELNQNWLEAQENHVNTGPGEYRTWWQVFKDPVLDRLIETAYRKNLNLRVAGLRVLEARAQLGAAVGQLYPQTQQATASVENVRESERVPASVNYSAAALGVTATWEIDFWGKFRRAVESADASLMASVANYDSVLVSLTGSAANLYVTIRTLERRLIIARSNVDTQRKSLQIARYRFEGGTTSKRDVEQARTRSGQHRGDGAGPANPVEAGRGCPEHTVGDAAESSGRATAGQGGGDSGAAAAGGRGHPGGPAAPAAGYPGARNTTPWPNAPRSASPRPSSTRRFLCSAPSASSPAPSIISALGDLFIGAAAPAPSAPR